VFFDFFHWFVSDVRTWITAVAHSHPFWVLPIAFVIAFSESFVGVSFIIPGTILLLSLGGVIGAAALLASYLPARRASRIPPVEALRAQ
jgi:ABC-type antimicrobial peptide transport system permease subunit